MKDLHCGGDGLFYIAQLGARVNGVFRTAASTVQQLLAPVARCFDVTIIAVILRYKHPERRCKAAPLRNRTRALVLLPLERSEVERDRHRRRAAVGRGRLGRRQAPPTLGPRLTVGGFAVQGPA
eukprot:COSAG02_NODE_7632_length_2925_cov_1.298655_2_plen_124_part_00